MTMSKTVFLILFLWTQAEAEAGASQPTELVAEAGRVRAKASVDTEVRPCRAGSSWSWGAENTCPQTVIVALEIMLGSKPIFIPLSAFADLGNPRTIRIEARKGKGQFAVVLTGGDAATSYSATLEFQSNLLRERVVRHGEFPEMSQEKTFYKFNTGP